MFRLDGGNPRRSHRGDAKTGAGSFAGCRRSPLKSEKIAEPLPSGFVIPRPDEMGESRHLAGDGRGEATADHLEKAMVCAGPFGSRVRTSRLNGFIDPRDGMSHCAGRARRQD